MSRLLACFVMVGVVCVQDWDRAAAEVKACALVQVADPKQGTISDIVVGHGIVESDNTLTRSFQRDGQVTDIFCRDRGPVQEGRSPAELRGGTGRVDHLLAGKDGPDP